MAAPDPSGWEEAFKYLWSVLLLPIGMVWKKMDGAVQKDDFREFMDRFDKHCDQDRETQAKLFDRIDDLKTTILESRLK